MARRKGETQINITNVTYEQKAVVDSIRKSTGESANALLKRLLRQEAERLGLEWPDDNLRDWNPQS